MRTDPAAPVAGSKVNDVLPATLPELLREIALHCGLVAALRLVEAHGGTEIFIPIKRESASGQALADLLGEHAAGALIRAYPGSRLPIPRCAQVLRDGRNQAILDAYDRGIPVRELARAHHLTTRQIRSILKQIPETGSVQLAQQLALF